MAARDGGFTLIEVLVALAVGAAVVLAAHRLFAVVADTVDRVPSETAAFERERNGERVLRALLARAESGTPGARGFIGEPERAAFLSWCPAPGGWLERCDVELELIRAGDSVRLEAAWAGRRLPVRVGAGHARLAYLWTAAGGGHWLERWAEGAVSPPRAVLVILGADSVLLRVGDPG